MDLRKIKKLIEMLQESDLNEIDVNIPYTIEVEGVNKVNVWQVVVGNFEQFKEIKEKELEPSEMQACRMISLV